MKNVIALGEILKNSEQKLINGGERGAPPTCPGCSHVYGQWLYTTLAGGPTGPGAPCGFSTSSGICYGVVAPNGTSCCS